MQCTKVAIQLIGQPIERGQFQFWKTEVDDPAISTSYSTGQYSTILGLVKLFVEFLQTIVKIWILLKLGTYIDSYSK